MNNMNNYLLIVILIIIGYFYFKPDMFYKPTQEEIQVLYAKWVRSSNS